MVSNKQELNAVKDLGIDLVTLLVRKHFHSIKDERELSREVCFSISKTINHWGYVGILKNLLKINGQDQRKVKDLVLTYPKKSASEINEVLSSLLSRHSLEIAPIFSRKENFQLVHQ